MEEKMEIMENVVNEVAEDILENASPDVDAVTNVIVEKSSNLKGILIGSGITLAAGIAVIFVRRFIKKRNKKKDDAIDVESEDISDSEDDFDVHFPDFSDDE